MTVEPFATGEVKPFPGSEVLEDLVGWKVSKLSFAPRQERKITIRYRAAHDRKGTTMSDNSNNNPPVFRYRLSTGGVWAGPIVKGRGHVKFIGTDARWAEIKRPASRFKRTSDDEANSWIWDFEKLEPTLADDIEIVAGPATYEYGGQGFIKIGERWQYEQKFKPVASSTLSSEPGFTYGAENVVGYDHPDGTYLAWSEGVPGDGVGESITLTVEKPLPLHVLSIHPGYGKSDALFAANGRPAELAITLNGEHRFAAILKDRNEPQRFLVPDYKKPVRLVRIEIRKVFPGDKFEDTCISDIKLVANLDKKPQVRGSR